MRAVSQGRAPPILSSLTEKLAIDRCCGAVNVAAGLLAAARACDVAQMGEERQPRLPESSAALEGAPSQQDRGQEVYLIRRR